MIKLSKGCKDCGYAAHAQALQFDHIGNDKKMNVSDMIRSDYSWETIKVEIDKCEVRCANCHAVVTAQRKVDSVLSTTHLPCVTAKRFRATGCRSAYEAILSLHAFDGSLPSTDRS